MRELLWSLVHCYCCQGNWVLISSGWMPKKTGYLEGKNLVTLNLLEIFSVRGSCFGAHNLKSNCKLPPAFHGIQMLYQIVVWFLFDAVIQWLSVSAIWDLKWKKVNNECRSLFNSSGNNTSLFFWQLKPAYGEKPILSI